jgi:hypothetical protein
MQPNVAEQRSLTPGRVSGQKGCRLTIEIKNINLRLKKIDPRPHADTNSHRLARPDPTDRRTAVRGRAGPLDGQGHRHRGRFRPAAAGPPVGRRPGVRRRLRAQPRLDQGDGADVRGQLPDREGPLARIAASLEFIDESPAPARASVLDRLAAGEITPDEAIKALEDGQ